MKRLIEVAILALIEVAILALIVLVSISGASELKFKDKRFTRESYDESIKII